MRYAILARRALARTHIAPIVLDEKFFQGTLARKLKWCGDTAGEAVPAALPAKR
jgi:hypothetical protein